MREIVSNIISETNEFLFGPRNAVKHTLDATKILNDYIVRHRLRLDKTDWFTAHKELIKELLRFKPAMDIQVVDGNKIPYEPTFHELPNYTENYYDRKATRTMEAVNWLVFLVAIGGIIYGVVRAYINVISSGVAIGN